MKYKLLIFLFFLNYGFIYNLYSNNSIELNITSNNKKYHVGNKVVFTITFTNDSNDIIYIFDRTHFSLYFYKDYFKKELLKSHKILIDGGLHLFFERDVPVLVEPGKEMEIEIHGYITDNKKKNQNEPDKFYFVLPDRYIDLKKGKNYINLEYYADEKLISFWSEKLKVDKKYFLKELELKKMIILKIDSN